MKELLRCPGLEFCLVGHGFFVKCGHEFSVYLRCFFFAVWCALECWKVAGLVWRGALLRRGDRMFLIYREKGLGLEACLVCETTEGGSDKQNNSRLPRG